MILEINSSIFFSPKMNALVSGHFIRAFLSVMLSSVSFCISREVFLSDVVSS